MFTDRAGDHLAVTPDDLQVRVVWWWSLGHASIAFNIPTRPGACTSGVAMRVALTVVAITGCASQLRSELVGQGATSMRTRGGETAPAAAIALPAGSYEIALAFELPRAQLVEWSVTCPGVDAHGSLGETLEAYRARRIAELRAERDRERHAVAAIVGAAVPPASARATVGGVEASASVSPGAIAGAAIPEVELAPGDVGAQRATGSVHIVTTGAGACVISAIADDVIAGHYQVSRIRD